MLLYLLFNKKMVDVTVLVATYNEDKYIGRCLRSLLNQTLPASKYEILVINDGSTDRTSYALDLFNQPKDNHIRIITNKSNKGLPESLNIGIEASKSKYLVRVDSDDYVNQNFLSSLSFYLDIFEDIGAVSCDYILVDKDENFIKVIDSKKSPIACGIMFRRQNLIDIGMYDPAFRCHEDQDLRIRFTKKFKINNINLPLYRYRKHENNMTNDKNFLDDYQKLLTSKHSK